MLSRAKHLLEAGHDHAAPLDHADPGGQAYILALFAIYLQGRAFLWPKSVGLKTYKQGYVERIKRTGRTYILVILTLAQFMKTLKSS